MSDDFSVSMIVFPHHLSHNGVLFAIGWKPNFDYTWTYGKNGEYLVLEFVHSEVVLSTCIAVSGLLLIFASDLTAKSDGQVAVCSECCSRPTSDHWHSEVGLHTPRPPRERGLSRLMHDLIYSNLKTFNVRSQAVARIANRSALQHLCGSRDVIGHVTI